MPSTAEDRKRRTTDRIFRRLGVSANHQRAGVTTPCRVIVSRGGELAPALSEVRRAEARETINVRIRQVPKVLADDVFVTDAKSYVVDAVIENDGRIIKSAVRP